MEETIQREQLTPEEQTKGKELFDKLFGEGFKTKPLYRGGLLEIPPERRIGEKNFSLTHMHNVMNTLSEEEINNVGALVMLSQGKIKYQQGVDELICWLINPLISMKTINRAFSVTAESISTLDEALKADNVYCAFLGQRWGCADNTWSIEKRNLPGYRVMPYFAAINFPPTLPMHGRDQYAYTYLTAQIRERLERSGIFDYNCGRKIIRNDRLFLVPRILADVRIRG